MLKKFAVFTVAAVMLASALKPASAAIIPTTPAVPVSSSATLGVAGGLAVGIIATAGILCIYDFLQKLNGQKNWDGTPKAVKAQHRRR